MVGPGGGDRPESTQEGRRRHHQVKVGIYAGERRGSRWRREEEGEEVEEGRKPTLSTINKTSFESVVKTPQKQVLSR